jgi:hypothetical protein
MGFFECLRVPGHHFRLAIGFCNRLPDNVSMEPRHEDLAFKNHYDAVFGVSGHFNVLWPCHWSGCQVDAGVKSVLSFFRDTWEA